MIYLPCDDWALPSNAPADYWRARPYTELDATADKCFMEFRMKVDPVTGKMVADMDMIRAGIDPHLGPDYLEISRRLGKECGPDGEIPPDDGQETLF